jgi:putative ABC transport system permease protein
MRNHLKLALKVLARRKVFTAISLVGTALTLVVLVVAVAIADSAFAPHAPQSRLDRIVSVNRIMEKGPGVTEIMNPAMAFSKRRCADFRTRSESRFSRISRPP